MKKRISRRFLVVPMVFVLSVILSAGVVVDTSRRQRSKNIEHGTYIMESEANKIQYSIDSRLLKLEILEMIIVDNDEGVRNFEKIAKRLYEDDPTIRSIQLAPGGNVTEVYPVAGNEDAYGDLFSDPDRRAEAEYARDTGNMTLAGPFELYQGGMGVVVRRPIYLEDEAGGKSFWGFAIAVMDVPEIFDKANLEGISGEGYIYQIARTQEDGEPQVIAGSGEALPRDAIYVEIQVPGSVWMFGMAPREGWLPWRGSLEKILIALLIDLLVTLIAYYFITVDRQKKELSRIANTDALTGLYNERFLSGELKKRIAAAEPFCLFFLDLNRFKAVNDTYGHDVGDKVLVGVAWRIQSCLDAGDYAFRIGGDEFSAVIAGEHPKEFYEALLVRIKETVEQPLEAGAQTLRPEISCGYSRYPHDQQDIDELAKEADRRMYEQKRGR